MIDQELSDVWTDIYCILRELPKISEQLSHFLLLFK